MRIPGMANRRAAPALVGFLHGVWHLPLMLLTTAYHPVGNRFIVVPIFLATLTVAGIFFGYLRDASGSIWPVIITHGTFNAVLGTLDDSAVSDTPLTAEYLTGETGLFTLAAVMIGVVILTGLGTGHRVTQPHPLPLSGEDRLRLPSA